MRIRITAPALAAVLFMALATFGDRPARGGPPDSQPTLLTIDDLYLYEGAQGLRLAPDGRSAVYARTWIDPASRRDRSSLWMNKEGEAKPRPLEPDEPDAHAPIFSPDGRWILFHSTRPRPEGWRQTPPVPPESDPATDLWLIPTDGGQAVPLAGPEKSYGRVFNDTFFGRLSFSPDGKRLAFVADDGEDPRTAEEREADDGEDPRTAEEREADVYVVRPDGGEGYTGYGPAQIWVADLSGEPETHAARRIERLTDDGFWYGDPQWSPDGKTLVVHANRTDDQESVRYSINKNYDIWAIDLKTHALRSLTTGPGPEVSPRFSPDGRRIACLSIPRKGSHRDVFNIALISLDDGGPSTRVVFDHHGPEAEKPPHPAPSFPLPEDCWDGDGFLIYSAEVGLDTQTARVDVQTVERTTLDPPPGDEDALKTFQGRGLRRRKLTPPTNAFLKNRLMSKSEVVRWEVDGRTIEGVLTVPPESVARPPYALIVEPHGGPHSRTGRGSGFNAQIFAASGYAVLAPNFRGSAGYGQAFIDADRGDFGGGDMRDILSGVDELIRGGRVDSDRQFVYGVSYGGYMTSWLVGQTNRFRAAVAQNAVTDLDMMWGLSDLPSWIEWEFGGRPWEVPRVLRDHSPLTFASRVQTPTLVLNSREDRRCPMPMGLMFHRALLASGVETQMVVYPDEGHGIRQPRHRADVLRRTLAWFQAHDKN